MTKQTLSFFLLMTPLMGVAQVGIGTISPDPSAKLQVDASSSGNAKGFLPPRVALTGTTDAATITSPATGLLIFNTGNVAGASGVTPGYYFYDGIKWQRLINQQPDATVEFSVHADPNTAGTTFEPSGAATSNVIYVSTINGSQWTYSGSAFVTYTPPASTAWYAAGGTTDAGSNKTGAIYRNGKLGIGTSTPGTSLEINASSANTSGLKFTNLTAVTPTTSGATLGVDASGNVVTVNGSSFSPDFGTASPSSTVNVNSGNSAELTRITITSKGTYLINYTMRVQPTSAVANQYAVGFLSLNNSTAIVGTEILGAFPGGSTVGAPGGNYSGSHVVTINTVPTSIYFRAGAFTGNMSFVDDGNGRTKVSFVKITP